MTLAGKSVGDHTYFNSCVHSSVYLVLDATVLGASTLCSDMLRVSGISYFVPLAATAMGIDYEVDHVRVGRFERLFESVKTK
jgi:hypothetical protein